MNIYSELPTAFPWYDNILKQNRFRENVIEKAPDDWALISPKNALLPFEFYKIGEAVISSWEVLTLDNAVISIFTISSNLGIRTTTKQGRFYLYYDGSELEDQTDMPMDLPPGTYYSRITFDDDAVFYSEIFMVPACFFLNNATSDVEFLKLEWWNNTDLPPVFYNDITAGVPYFKNVVYLDSFIHESAPEIIEDGEPDGNQEVIPTFTKAILRYRISELVPDYLKIALVLMQMHDNVTITTRKGLRSGQPDRISTSTAPEASGALSVIDILFEDDILVKKGCGMNMQ